MSEENTTPSVASLAVERTAGARERLQRALYPLAGLIVILVVWELASGQLFNQYFLSKPSSILVELSRSFEEGLLVPNILFTVRGTAIAFLIAAVAGIVVAATFAGYRGIGAVFSPYITFTYVLPKIALAPVLFIWLGIGAPTQITIGALTAFFLVFYSSYHGMRQVSPALQNTVLLLGASRFQILSRVLIQGAAPHIMQGLRLGAIYAFHGAVVGEMVASNEGLGYAIIFASTRSSSVGVLANLVVLGAVAYLFTQIVEYIFERVDPSRREVKN